MERMTIVSADGHGGPPYEEYRQYFDPEYRDRVDDLANDNQLVFMALQFARNQKADLLDSVDDRGVLASGIALDMYWDTGKRLAQMDAEGIAGDMVLAGSDYALPFFHELNDHYPADLRVAGARAWHRWLADFTGASGGRLFGNGYSLPTDDVNAMIAEMQWVKEHDFASIEVPCFVHDDTLPPLHSEVYEPYWAAVAEAGIVLQAHAGWGIHQGELNEMFGKFQILLPTLTPEQMEDPMLMMRMMVGDGEDLFQDLRFRKVLWKLMMSGVFDRHPNLKLVLTEMRCDWLPAALAHLDKKFEERAADFKVKLKPSEYFARNCAITPSSPRVHEVALRNEIGVDKLMFGADMPHPEGTWPNTNQWLKHTFAGVGEDDMRKILGENAISFFGFDRGPLDAAAARIGPTHAEITAGAEVDQRVLDHWDSRSGYLKDPEVLNTRGVDVLMEEDLARF